MGKVYAGDIGTDIRIDMQEDLTGYSIAKLRVRKPNGSIVEWVPSVIENANGVLQILKYITLEGDVNIRGTYKIQPYLEFSNWKGSGTTVILEAHGAHG